MSLLQCLLEGGSVRTMGEVVLVVLGRGRGALVTFPLEYSSIRKWAENRSATGVEYRDLNIFLGRFETCVARAGSSLTTKGHPKNLLQLAKAMKSSGLELSDWTFPNEVRDALKVKIPVTTEQLKKDVDQEDDETPPDSQKDETR